MDSFRTTFWYVHGTKATPMKIDFNPDGKTIKVNLRKCFQD